MKCSEGALSPHYYIRVGGSWEDELSKSSLNWYFALYPDFSLAGLMFTILNWLKAVFWGQLQDSVHPESSFP